MTGSRRSYLKATLGYRQKCECSTGPAAEPPPCVAPDVGNLTLDAAVGTPISVFAPLVAGTFPGTWDIVGAALGLSINPLTGLITGTQPLGGGTITFRFTNECGNDTGTLIMTIPASAALVRYGSFTIGGAPTPAPTFIAADFTGGGPQSANYSQVAQSSPASVNGTYIFPPGVGIRQIMWIADSRIGGSPSFIVNGAFPWGLDPVTTPPTALQSLTIAGVPGKIYFGSDQNNGGFSLAISGMVP